MRDDPGGRLELLRSSYAPLPGAEAVHLRYRRAALAASVRFATHPSPLSWYLAHNVTIVSAYLEHRDLAERENRVERFFLNLVLMRLLYAHCLVAAARLALSWLSPTAGWLGDPRRAMTGLFLSIARVLPDAYPLNGQLDTYVAADPSRTNPSPRSAARLDGCAGRVLGHTVTWLMRRGCAALLACPGRPHLADERLPHAQRQGLLHAPRRGGARTAA